MRVMVIVKANKDTEAGIMPSEQLLREMGNYNEQLVKAGVMLAGEGLKPTSQGARIRFSGNNRTVIDVFAHDRPGLLYSVSRAIYELGLSVDFARISTHYDQVVDVFYVREANGRKVSGEERLNQIRDELTVTLEEFENGGYRRFVS